MSKRLVLIFMLVLLSQNHLFAQENSDPDFDLSFGLKYLSRFVAYGIDLAEDRPAWSFSSSLSHRSGFYTNISFTRPTITTFNAQQFSIDLGYEKEFSERFSMYGEFSHYVFSNDTVNVFSQFSNSISLNADMDLEYFDIGVSYDRFIGGSGASYFSIDISTFQSIGPVYLLPLMQMVFMSQTIEERYLDKDKGKKNNSVEEITSSTTLSGLSNTMITLVAMYPVAESVNLYLASSVIKYHKTELSDDSIGFFWNTGVRYKINF